MGNGRAWRLAGFDAALRFWKVDMRALKFAGAAVAAVIVIIAIVLVVGIPSGFLSSAIASRVESATGYRLTIAGSTKLSLWPTLNVTLNDLTLQDPKDRSGINRLTVESVQADMSLSSAWSGKPKISEIVITHPVLYQPLSVLIDLPLVGHVLPCLDGPR